ncbi:hypothetical protein GCM10020358_59130 [Amorphoplanes nipponensis]|uniref:Fibronectin type-III domain-containing protein n=1 Tax=Actinoplanes nipponensis TaxID=135950 RepID=A0A919JC58_9ACTN|nr:hypothetical protein Ani05nite_04260 [Actinoplanes nipponensis]
MLEHAVDLGRANLGEDDPDVLLTAQQLAAVHQRAGDPSGARRVLEEAYAAGQWRLGDADPVMVGISYDLGVVAEEMENRHEARRAFGRVAAHGPAALGADHWAVVRARSYLGEDPPTVRIELPAEQVPRLPAPQQPPVRPQPAPVPQQQVVVEPQPRHFPAPPQAQSPARYEPPPITPAAVPARAGNSSYSRKAPALFAAIAAVLGVIIAVVALVIVLAYRDDDPASDVPTLAGPAPTDVRMRDYGSSVKLFWADPANGRASFVITGGRPGEQLRPMGQVGPTTTTFNLNGLNADLDYCFAVVAVYTTSQFSTSPQTCTSRSGPSSSSPPGKR